MECGKSMAYPEILPAGCITLVGGGNDIEF